MLHPPAEQDVDTYSEVLTIFGRRAAEAEAQTERRVTAGSASRRGGRFRRMLTGVSGRWSSLTTVIGTRSTQMQRASPPISTSRLR